MERDRRSGWEGFANRDPYFYIDTDFDRIRDEPDAVDRFYESGRAAAATLLGEVAPLLSGRSLGIEIGCGAGRVLLGHAQDFERLRGVDIAPRMLSLTEERATAVGIDNVQVFLPTDPWDEPTESADYVYSVLVFQHIESAPEIATYIQRIGSVLRRGGIAQLQFHTRPRGALYRARQLIPDRLLGRTQRRGIRRVRRPEQWVRNRLRGAELEFLSERKPGTAAHWFVARRR